MAVSPITESSGRGRSPRRQARAKGSIAAKTRLTSTKRSSSMAKGVLNWTPTLAARKAEDHRKTNTSGRMTRNSMLSGRPVQARGKPGGNGGAKRLMRGGRPVNGVEIGGGGIFVAVDKPDPGRGACRPEDRGQFL